MGTGLQLYLIREPRTLILSSGEYALVFKNPPSGNGAGPTATTDQPAVVVELLPRDDVRWEHAVMVNGRVHGSLGVLNVAGETFVSLITASSPVGLSSRTLPFTGLGAEPISRILALDFYCLSSPAYDYLHAPLNAANTQGGSAFDPSVSSYTDESTRPDPSIAGQEHPCHQIRKILSNQSFYFASGTADEQFDISTRLEARVARAHEQQQRQRQGPGAAAADVDVGDVEDGYVSSLFTHDRRFLYNHFLLSPLLSFRSSLPLPARTIFDRQGFLVLAIQGFVGVYEISLAGKPAILSLVSRLGWKRAGTRFNVRGVDDEGGVANFAETETILRTENLCFSYVQTRGSVPLFWEEGGSQPFNPKITITRPLEASLPAFLRHFEDLLETYPNPPLEKIQILNLLSREKEGEASLTRSYQEHLKKAREVDENVAERVGWTEFDFHLVSRMVGGIEGIRRALTDELGGKEEFFGSFVVGFENGKEKDEEAMTVVMKQSGIFRTNCKGLASRLRLAMFCELPIDYTLSCLKLDCLDRTNAVQDSLSAFALSSFVRNTTDPTLAGLDASLWAAHRTLWADNGDALSKAYVGTGAINSSFTRSGKKSFAGMLSDASKSVNRVFQQQLFDTSKQRAIDALLGNLATSRKVRIFDPLNDTLRARLRARASEFTTHHPTTIWVGTYNLNGKPPSSESLLPWLFPIEDGPDPAFLVFAFQEIVPLSPQMIMATDPEKKRKWEQHILTTVRNRPGGEKKADYILLRSGQLVGTALIVLCLKDIVGDVRNVEVATKKTGLKGMAGNKGAVAVRLDYRSTSFCFLTAHLAAGHSNVEERNQDFFTINEGLHFARGKIISSHDNIVWAADTNYRINMSNEEARPLAENDDYEALFKEDQLSQAMRTRGVFKGYHEAPILFRPTYKYDNGTDTYDTSEKMRVPAYTDRIIYRGQDLDVNRYSRAELYNSDHRPVYAIFRAMVRSVDHVKQSALRKQLLHDLLQHAPDEKLDDKLTRLAAANVSDEVDLPPPSDDSQAWWNDENGVFQRPILPSQPLGSSVTSLSPQISPRKPSPAVPRKPVLPPTGPPIDQLVDFEPNDTTTASVAPPPSFQAVRRKPPPPVRTTSPTRSLSMSLEDISLGQGKKPPPIPQRPSNSVRTDRDRGEIERQTTGDSWQVL
ncbi:uncharacterized protein JCM15063_001462 [Sporobolomyces koalae]|uniref:uncharacterized protein n=1 Tax=Sporobolomyces koalae TaxID=500713 RepID=UPI00317A1C2C